MTTLQLVKNIDEESKTPGPLDQTWFANLPEQDKRAILRELMKHLIGKMFETCQPGSP